MVGAYGEDDCFFLLRGNPAVGSELTDSPAHPGDPPPHLHQGRTSQGCSQRKAKHNQNQATPACKGTLLMASSARGLLFNSQVVSNSSRTPCNPLWIAAHLASLSLISPRVYSNSCPLSQCWGLDGDKWKASEPLLDSLSIACGLGFFLPNSPSFSLQQHGPKHLPLHNLAFFPFILHGYFDSQRSELMLPCCMAVSIPP